MNWGGKYRVVEESSYLQDSTCKTNGTCWGKRTEKRNDTQLDLENRKNGVAINSDAKNYRMKKFIEKEQNFSLHMLSLKCP